jgi:hypothetical protein
MDLQLMVFSALGLLIFFYFVNFVYKHFKYKKKEMSKEDLNQFKNVGSSSEKQKIKPPPLYSDSVHLGDKYEREEDEKNRK